jgi:signal transduction histidine kinase/ActR/RegA family two-component response regulator
MAPDRPGAKRILVCAALSRDAQLACEFLRGAGFDAGAAASLDEAVEIVRSGLLGALLVTEDGLSERGWASLTRALEDQPPWSDLPIIVFAAHPGQVLREALERQRGNVTVIETPVRVATVITAARSALRTRERQYELRDLLARQHDLLRRLADADRRKDEFLAMLGHELRNPLAAIHNALNVIRQAGGEHAERHHAVIERQARNLARIVDDLLDVSRVTLGKIRVERQRVELVELARRCVAAFAQDARARDHELFVTAEAGGIVVDGDAFRLEQVLSNLVANAIKYTPPGGRIAIRVGAEESQAVLAVRDNGIGIAPAMLSSVFELFTQARQGLDRSRGGLGLGLSLVRSLVALHGGTIQAYSEGEGKGSEFVVRLPLVARLAASDTPAESAPPVLPALRVVLVEDNDDARETLRALLELMGNEVEEAVDGLEGLDRIFRVRPDVALIDIGLPKLDGYEVARQVRAATVGAAPLLVAMTGYGQPEDRHRALEAGFDVHMVKPVSVRELAKVFARVGGEARSAERG